MKTKSKPALSYTRSLVFAAILLAFALVVNYFTKINIPIGGAPALRISFGGPFLRMAALLLGPLYGGICGALSDYLSEVIKPTGAFLWPLTVTAFAYNALVGLLWKYLKKIEFRKFNAAYISVFSALAALGAVNLLVSRVFPGSAYNELLHNMGASRRDADTLSIGLLAAGLIGLATHLTVWFLTRKSKSPATFELYLRLIICVMLPGLLYTTANTFVLQHFGILAGNTFVFIWIPRLIKEIIFSLYNIYVAAILLKAYETVKIRLF